MRRRCVATVFVVTAMVSLAVPAAGQRAHEWTVARTLDGQPDLQGAWSFATITPLERPRGVCRAPVSEQRGSGRAGTKMPQRGRRLSVAGRSPSSVTSTWRMTSSGGTVGHQMAGRR